MKRILNGILLIAAFAMTIQSCKKDETKDFFTGGTAPVLSASTNDSITLLQANASQNALTLTWTNPNYTFTTGESSQDVSYTVEIDTAGANFASTVKKTYTIAKDVSLSLTVADLNSVLVNTMGLAVNEPHTIEMRVLSSINKSAPTQLMSNVLSLSVTPYDQPIIITYLYIPGNYQGWSPSTAPAVGATDTKNYEGYVYFSESNGEFKITTNPDWDHTNYGDGGAGALSTTGGNLKLPGVAGMYVTKINLPALTWSVTKTDWSMIGAATPNGWDKDTPLTYDAASNTLQIASIALTADEFKFRANAGWDINLGLDANGSAYLAYGGGNLKVQEAGTYKVVLDLSHPFQYTYTLTKL